MSPEFPNYQQQVSLPEPQSEPNGVPLGIRNVDPKYNKPLLKMMQKMMKTKRPKIRTGRMKKKKVGF